MVVVVVVVVVAVAVAVAVAVVVLWRWIRELTALCAFTHALRWLDYTSLLKLEDMWPESIICEEFSAM